MITRTALHSIRALVCLARQPKGSYAGASALARAIDAPPNYLGKLLQTLGRAGLVESRKGLRGGFRLARDPARITLFEIIEPIEHVSRWEGCFLGGAPCSDKDPCGMNERWGTLRDAYLELLAETTVAELAKNESGPDAR